MTEEVVNYRIEYDIRGVDRSIRSTQRLLYAMNALRLSIVDLQKLSTDFSLQHLFWAGIQLTRTWTLLYNLVKKTNQAQRIGIAQGVIGGGIGTATRGITARNFALGQTMLTLGAGGQLGVTTPTNVGLMALIAANPYVAGGIAAALLTAGLVGYDMQQKRILKEWRTRQREIAKSQGLEN